MHFILTLAETEQEIDLLGLQSLAGHFNLSFPYPDSTSLRPLPLTTM